MEERVQKILARHGFGSRRACEELIQAGRIRVNGKVVAIGAKADASIDEIEMDGKKLPTSFPKPVYIALHKPRGVLSDLNFEDARPNVLSLVPVSDQLFPVGRLDFNSEGLMLLTNDGELANKLTHPRYGHEKEYRVQIGKRPDLEQLMIWRRGVVLEDGYRTAPARVEIESTAGNKTWLRVVMREGKKRQIREIGIRIGLPVHRIIRIRIGNLLLGKLKPKEWRFLTPQEVAGLKSLSPRKKRDNP